MVAGVIVMLNFLTAALGAATSRFITFDLGKGDLELLKKTFGNILSIYLIWAVIIIVVGETIGLWFVSNKLQIPVERQYAALWVYQLSIFSSIMAVISAPYNACIIAHEKMSAFAYIFHPRRRTEVVGSPHFAGDSIRQADYLRYIGFCCPNSDSYNLWRILF